MLDAALFGLGRWGQRLAQAIAGSDRIRLLCGASRDPARHGEFTAQSGIPVVGWEQALADPRIRAVLIATPHSVHAVHVVQAARAGKHVYVEKPLALTRDAAADAVAACSAAGVTLGVGFSRRYVPAFAELLRRVRAGDIGDVLHIDANFSGPTGHTLKPGSWRATRAEAPGGGMTARGIHTLDAMIQLGGLVREVYAHSERRVMPPSIDMDDVTTMLLRFEGGATGTLTTLFVTAELWRVHVFGSRGWIEMRSEAALEVAGLEGKPERIDFAPVNRERAMLDSFADAVAAGAPNMMPPDEILNGVAVLEAIVTSAETGKPVAVR